MVKVLKSVKSAQTDKYLRTLEKRLLDLHTQGDGKQAQEIQASTVSVRGTGHYQGGTEEQRRNVGGVDSPVTPPSPGFTAMPSCTISPLSHVESPIKHTTH